MPDEIVNYIPCAFINSYGQPVKRSPFKSFHVSDTGDSLRLGGIRTYYYPHPDAPEHALLTVETWEEIMDVKPNVPEYSALFLFMHAENALKALPGYQNHLEATKDKLEQ